MSHSVETSSKAGKVLRGIPTLAAFCSFLLAMIAFCIRSHDGSFQAFLEALYPSARVVALHSEEEFQNAGEATRLLLHIAKVLAVFFWGSAAVALVVEFFGKTVRRKWITWRANHTVICGSGPLAGQFAQQAGRAGDHVLLLDHGRDEALPKAGVDRASSIVAVGNNDYDNIAVVLRAAALIRKSPRASRPCTAFVHINDPELLWHLRRQKLFRFRQQQPRIKMFSLLENSARLMLRDNPLDFRTIGPESPLVVQLILLGFGVMGEPILTRALMAGHYANLKPMRILIVDREADRKKRLFHCRYPTLAEIAKVEFLEADARECATQAEIAKRCGASDTITTVVVSFTEGVAVAMALAERVQQDIQILLRLDDGSDLAALLTGPGRQEFPSRRIRAFRAIPEIADRARGWVDTELDAMANAVHNDYLAKLPPDRPEGPSTVSWDLLDDDLADSNRQAADHIPVKLRALDYRAVSVANRDDGVPAPPFTKDQVEFLAMMEHRRWMAERYLAGWTRGPKDNDRRISPYLVEWEDLSEDIRQYDRNSVLNIPKLLRDRGLEMRQ
jgi:hypothetical protein